MREFFYAVFIVLLKNIQLVKGLGVCDEKNKCDLNADCSLEPTKAGGQRVQCTCRPGFSGDGITCKEHFTLVIELCQDENGDLIEDVIGKNTKKKYLKESMTLVFWMENELGEPNFAQKSYYMPNVTTGEKASINYFNDIDIFHITKLKVLQKVWQKICLQRLSLHQGNNGVYILREFETSTYVPHWADCTNKEDKERCRIYTWWNKKCQNEKGDKFGMKSACRTRHMYKSKDGSDGERLLKIDKNECVEELHDCSPDAHCIEKNPSFACQCKNGYTGNGKTCTDIDECAIGSHLCHAHASCQNTVGSFDCSCNAGFSGNGFSCSEMCLSDQLPKNAITISESAKRTTKGAVFRVDCKKGHITPTDPSQITKPISYKANCRCEDFDCFWTLTPNFSCEVGGCPHPHLAAIRVIRTWADTKERRTGLFQIKFKVKIKIPDGHTDSWRVLVKFGDIVPETSKLRTRKSKVLSQSGSQILLGNESSNGVITHEERSRGFLFKLTHLTKPEKDSLVKNLESYYVGSDVNDLDCF
jgi:hypothetical protein